MLFQPTEPYITSTYTKFRLSRTHLSRADTLQKSLWPIIRVEVPPLINSYYSHCHELPQELDSGKGWSNFHCLVDYDRRSHTIPESNSYNSNSIAYCSGSSQKIPSNFIMEPQYLFSTHLYTSKNNILPLNSSIYAQFRSKAFTIIVEFSGVIGGHSVF